MNELQELVELADSGDIKAQEKVAVAYLKGNGVEKDINKAIELLKKSAENGSGMCNYQLGKIYESGNGVDINMETAISYYKKSAELGYANAQNVLKKMEQSTKIADVNSTTKGSGYIPPSVPSSSIPKMGETQSANVQQKSKVVAALLAFLIGSLGIHNFYLGNTKKGIIQLIITITLIGAPISQIWALIEFFMILTGNINCDSNGYSLK